MEDITIKRGVALPKTKSGSAALVSDARLQCALYSLLDKGCLYITPDDVPSSYIVYLLEGRFQMDGDGGPAGLDAGDCVLFSDSRQSHRLESQGSSRFLLISTTSQEVGLSENIARILEMVENKDTYTYGHSRRVCLYATAIALAWQADYNILELGWAATLHDLGKINVPKSILQKPGALSDEEWALIKQHPTDSCRMIEELNGGSRRVALAAWQHHERLDGSGYPQGLRGDEICLDARIIAVADVFDAMTSRRSYHPARSPMEAVEFIERHPEQFDSRFAAVLRQKVENGSFQPESEQPPEAEQPCGGA